MEVPTALLHSIYIIPTASRSSRRLPLPLPDSRVDLTNAKLHITTEENSPSFLPSFLLYYITIQAVVSARNVTAMRNQIPWPEDVATRTSIDVVGGDDA